MIRILQVFPRFRYGGIPILVLNFYRNIDREKIQFDFLVFDDEKNGISDEILSLGGRIYRLPKFNGKNLNKVLQDWGKFFINHKEYKIIHFHVRSTASIYIPIAKKYGLTTIIHSHSTSNGSGFSSVVKSVLQYPLRYQADYLFSCSQIAGEWLFGKKATSQPNYFIIKNAIDTKKYKFDEDIREQYRKEFNLENKTVYGHVGRLSEPKNHMFLLEVFRKIVDKDSNSVLLLIGGGELENTIKQKISDLNLNKNVIMTGSRNDIPNVLQAMDLFLFPSLWEGLPVTVVEAQASGLPCLVSDTVTNEVKLSDAVTYLPIDKGTDIWAEKALSASKERIRNSVDIVTNAGFDIESSSKWLMDFYTEIYKNRR